MPSALFEPLTLRELTFRNRIFVSPMCQYSSDDGMPTDWHLVHLGSRAVGGAALVMVEATGVSPEGRISPWDSGIWSAEHGRAFARITRFIKEQGSVPGVQLAHAGRKASTGRPWLGGGAVATANGGWQPIAPSPIAFDKASAVPREMTLVDIDAVVNQFVNAAKWSLEGGFEVVELHMAHGYLLHEFLSPLSNQRTDSFGGPFENRTRLPLRVARAVREVWPSRLPVFVRISVTDWADGGWDLPQSIRLGKLLKDAGIDLIDCSSGGLVPYAKITLGPGYQVPFAAAIRKEAGIATGAVGMITEPAQAQDIIAQGQADAVLLARELLRDPYWPIRAAQALAPKSSGRLNTAGPKPNDLYTTRYFHSPSALIISFLGEKPRAMSATLTHLNVSPGGMPKSPVLFAQVTKQGVEGDHQTHTNIHGGTDRAVCLYSEELYEWLATQGVYISPGDVGENFTTRGLDLQSLAPGDKLAVGQCVIEITKVRIPCAQLNAIHPQLLHIIQGRSGWMAKVIEEAMVRPGDAIEILATIEE